MAKTIKVVSCNYGSDFQDRVNALLKDGGKIIFTNSGYTDCSEWFHAMIETEDDNEQATKEKAA